MAVHTDPEITRTPLSNLCLTITSLGISNPQSFLSQAMQRPDPQAVEHAMHYLQMIGAIEENCEREKGITEGEKGTH